MSEDKRTTIAIEQTIWKKSKIQAINENLKLDQLVEKALREYLERHEIK